jgi:hypothetical protein
MAWREDMRRHATGTQFNACGRLALGHPPSRAWIEYWQRHRLKGGTSSSRLIGDPPEDAVAGAVRREQSTFVEAVQRVSDFPLDVGEAGAIGWVKPVVDHHGPDEVWCADRRTREGANARSQFAVMIPAQMEDGMAEADQIPSDLTLELGGDLSPQRFMAAANAFFGYVQEISRAVAPEGEAPDWIVRTREGSHLLGLDPAPGAKAQVLKAIYTRARLGIDQLTDGERGDGAAKSPLLPDGAIKHLKALSEMSDRPQRNPVAVRLWIEKKPKPIGHQLAEAIMERWGEDYRDFGTIEGKLDAIQDRNNLQIRVYDAVLRQTVICHVDEGMLPEVFANFRKRVEVSGIIHYRRNGVPIGIDVESIERLLDDSELPSLDDVRGILRPEE